MRKSCFALTLILLAASPASPAEDAKQLTIRWHGQSFFEIITTKGTRIVLDPHAIEAYGRKVVQADIVLITHNHDDHTQIAVVENANKAKVINALKVEKGEFRALEEWNVVDEKIKDVRIRTLGTYHDNAGGMTRGKNGVFILDVDGLRIVHLGDLGHSLSDIQLRRLGPVDILMVPVGGVYTLNGLDAAKVVEQIKPRRYIFPMHYGTLVYDYLLPATTFLDEFKKENIKKFATNEIMIDPRAPVPAEPLIVVPHWRGDK